MDAGMAGQRPASEMTGRDRQGYGENMEDREGSQGPEINIEVIQSEPWGQEKGTECQYREVQRDRHPKKQEEISARDGGRRPRWQHRWIGWHPEKQSPRTDAKAAVEQEKVDGEDRGVQTGVSEGSSPAQPPSRCLTGTTFPLNGEVLTPRLSVLRSGGPIHLHVPHRQLASHLWRRPQETSALYPSPCSAPRPSVSLPLIP